jgi:hypothetical protein
MRGSPALRWEKASHHEASVVPFGEARTAVISLIRIPQRLEMVGFLPTMASSSSHDQ